jgi:small subunit ribosomal protein S21
VKIHFFRPLFLSPSFPFVFSPFLFVGTLRKKNRFTGPFALHTLFDVTPRQEDFILAHHVGVGVKVRDKENIDRALRRFKRAVNRSRVLRMYRQNMSYTKPSEERRVAKEKAARNARKHNRRY